MRKTANLPSNEDIIYAVNKWVISLSELAWAIQNRLNNTLVWDIPLEALPLISGFKTLPDEAEIKKFNEIEEYINNTSPLRKNSNKPTLQESNWKKYLVLWQEDIFEVIKQKWTIYIAHHPIKDTHIVYKFLWEESNQNTSLLWWIDKIDETEIDGYYKVIFWGKKPPLRFTDHRTWKVFLLDLWAQKEITKVSYFYIWENWETQYLWDFEQIWELKKHWNAVFFTWQNLYRKPEIVVHNWTQIKTIPYWYENARNSQSWRHLLHIIYTDTRKQYTSSLFDLDKMVFIFEYADEFDPRMHFPKDNVWTFEDKISWAFHKPRKWFGKVLWDKITRHEGIL